MQKKPRECAKRQGGIIPEAMGSGKVGQHAHGPPFRQRTRQGRILSPVKACELKNAKDAAAECGRQQEPEEKRSARKEGDVVGINTRPSLFQRGHAMGADGNAANRGHWSACRVLSRFTRAGGRPMSRASGFSGTPTRTGSEITGGRFLGASAAFGSSIVAVALAASPPEPLACRGLSGIPWQLEAFHGFVGGYYILQIGFVPCMLWVTRERQDPDSVALIVTWVLLWACALLQIAAIGVLGDIAACTGNSQLLMAFWFQVLPVLWTTLYDGVVYVANISRIPTTSGSAASQRLFYA